MCLWIPSNWAGILYGNLQACSWVGEQGPIAAGAAYSPPVPLWWILSPLAPVPLLCFLLFASWGPLHVVFWVLFLSIFLFSLLPGLPKGQCFWLVLCPHNGAHWCPRLWWWLIQSKHLTLWAVAAPWFTMGHCLIKTVWIENLVSLERTLNTSKLLLLPAQWHSSLWSICCFPLWLYGWELWLVATVLQLKEHCTV